MDDCIQSYVASDATPSTQAHFNASMYVGVESIFKTIVRFGGNDVLKSSDDIHKIMAHIKDELDGGAFFWYKVCVAIGRRPVQQ